MHEHGEERAEITHLSECPLTHCFHIITNNTSKHFHDRVSLCVEERDVSLCAFCAEVREILLRERCVFVRDC